MTLINHTETVRDFADLNQETAKRDVLRELSDRRYRLGSYKAFDGTDRYGIISTGGAAIENAAFPPRLTAKHSPQPLDLP